MGTNWTLYLDDERTPPPALAYSLPDSDRLVVCRSSQEAADVCLANGMPTYMSLDHDLGGDDTTMVFLKRIVNEVWNGEESSIPAYIVHSANPVGKLNIIAYMESWHKSCKLE